MTSDNSFCFVRAKFEYCSQFGLKMVSETQVGCKSTNVKYDVTFAAPRGNIATIQSSARSFRALVDLQLSCWISVDHQHKCFACFIYSYSQPSVYPILRAL